MACRTFSMLTLIFLSAASGALPRSIADEDDTWVGKKVILKKPGVKFGRINSSGRQVPIATLTEMVYTVLNEKDKWIEVSERGAEGWFAKENAVRLQDAVSTRDLALPTIRLHGLGQYASKMKCATARRQSSTPRTRAN
jgi:hypothetical protein